MFPPYFPIPTRLRPCQTQSTKRYGYFSFPFLARDAGRHLYADHHKLIDTGRFFKSSGSFQSRVQLKKSIPASYDRFQIALDSLSEQIVRRLLRRSLVDFALTCISSLLPRHFSKMTTKQSSPKNQPRRSSLRAPSRRPKTLLCQRHHQLLP
jgi:hypothetical protein